MNNCKQCGTETKNPKFCSRSCCGKYMQNDEEFRKKIKRSHSSKPLSKKHRENIKNGLLVLYKKQRDNLIQSKDFNDLPKGLRQKLFKEEKGNKCEECNFQYSDPISEKGPFEIHHKDGNHNNWIKENLIMLCLNCHWKTDDYRFRNRVHTKETKTKISENNYYKNKI